MSAGTLLRKYRRLFNGSLIENRSTYLNDADQVAAIQLSVLFLQKEFQITDTLSPEQLFEFKRKICCRKLGNAETKDAVSCTPNIKDVLPYTSNIKEVLPHTSNIPFNDVYNSYVSFTKHCNMIDNADVNILAKCQGEDEKENDVGRINEGSRDENPLSSPHASHHQTATPIRSDYPASSKSPSAWKTPLRSHLTPCSAFPSSPKDPSDVQLRRVLVSYMQLLVNSRNEIALARVIDLPTRGIGRNSFTDIRKVAVEKRMPMFQVISSFVRQCILGGKGYAPSEEHALYQHKEGLVEFIDLMDKLQTIVDDGTKINSVITALLKTLKVAFLRAKQPVFSARNVSLVVQELQTVAKQLASSDENNLDLSLLLRDYIDLVSCLAGNEISSDSSQLCGILSTPDVSSTTYKKINTLVTNFKTPLPCEETPIKSSEKEMEDVEEMEYVTNRDIPNTPIVGRDRHEEKEKNVTNAEYPEECEIDAPVKLIRCKISTGSQREVASKPDIFSKKGQVGGQRSSKNPVANTTAITSNAKDVPTAKRRAAKPKSKCVKKIKLVTGQKTLTQFFNK